MTHSITRSNSIIEPLSVALLLALYVALALVHAWLAPLTTGPDELPHYEYANFIAEHGRLPLTPAERDRAGYKSDQPPFYHLLAALPMGLVNTDGPSLLKRVGDNPRRQLIERTRHAWGLYNTLDEQWPYRGEVLRWQIGRWVAIFFGLLTVLVTYLLARWFFAGRWPLALAAAAVVAFIPRFILTGSMFNYETTLAFFAALFLWLLLKISESANQRISESANHSSLVIRHFPLLPTSYFLLPFFVGLLAGLAIVSKLSAVILPLEIAIAFGLIGRSAGLGWRVWLRWLLWAALGVLLPVGLWYGFVLAQFNTVASDGLWAGLLRPLIAADSSDATTNRLLSWLTGGQAGFTAAIDNLDSGPPWAWAATFYRTFWSVGIETVQPLGLPGLIIAGALLAVAAAGLLRRWAETGARPEFGIPRLALSLLLLHLLLPIVLPLVRYATTFSLADTAQGRHMLFQAAPAFALLLVWGLVASFEFTVLSLKVAAQHATRNRENFATTFAFIPAVFLLIWSLVQAQTMSWAYLPPLPVTVQPERVPPLDQRLDAALSPEVTLLGVNTQIDPANRLLRVDMWWRAEAVSPVDYLTHLALLNAAGQPQAEWLSHPAAGRYPTRAWDPGDVVHDTAWLPLGGLAAGDYELALQLRPTAAAVPPQAAARAEPLRLGPVTVPDSTLRVFESAFPIPELGAAAGYTVWQSGRPVTRAQPFRYRETITVSLPPLPNSFDRRLQMLTHTPAGDVLAFDPVLLSDTQALFIVGPDWPGGDYHLQATLTTPQQSDVVGNSVVIAQITDRWQRQFAEPPVSHALRANFANQIELIGYDLPANRAEPGGGLPLTLYWRGLDWLGTDITIFTKLIKADDHSLHGARDRLPQEGYRTLYWAPGEVVTDPFGLPVDADAPDGIYFVNIGLYITVNGQAVSLPLVQGDTLSDVTSVNLGPVKIGATPPEFLSSLPRPSVAVNQTLGEQITLLGYSLTDEAGQSIVNPKSKIENLKLIFYWRPEAIPAADYTTFVHLRNAAGETVAQKDQPPLNGAYPTSLWEGGEVIADEVDLPLPPDLSPGNYSLVVGLYDFNTGQRLAVPGNPANEITLQQLTISDKQ